MDKSITISAMFVILELFTETLNVEVPKDLQNRKVNLNEIIEIDIDYVKPADEIFYSLTIEYKS